MPSDSARVTRPMRILMVHNEYAKPSGEEHAVRAIAGLLEAKGHEIRWMLRSSAEIAESLSGNVKSFFAGIYSPFARRAMHEALEREQPDLVQVQNLYPLLSPAILGPCRQRGVPVVMRCPNYRLFCPNGLHLSHGRVCEDCLRLGREWWCLWHNCENHRLKSLGYALRNAFARVTRMILDNVSMFVVLSEFQRQRFAACGIPPERVAIVPNFDLDYRDLGERSDDPGETISFAGRLSPEKGIADFISAARALPHLPFAVAGDLSRMPDLAHSAPANVAFHGFLSGEALNEFYRKTRVFVFPSVWFEGFPNVVTRAMSFAKPVVAARIGAIPEIVEDGIHGLLFAPHDAAGLAAKIETLYSDPTRCAAMGGAARSKVAACYHPDVAYKALLRIYDQLLVKGY